MIWRTRRDSLNQLDQDIRDHMDRETEDNIARGMAPDAAYAAARRAFGNVTRAKEATRAVWVPIWIDQLLQDVRYAIRMFRRTPGFTAVVILTLALGIGLNTAVFSVVNAVLMRPLSYQHPERLVWIATYDDRAPMMEMVIGPDVLAWRDHATTIERIAAFSIGTERIAARDEVVAARIATVSNEFWDLAGGALALGRLPGPDEDAIVLSHGFFERAFGADASMVGKPVAVNGRQVVVAGVLPPSFGAELPPPVGSQLPAGPLDGYHATVVQPLDPNSPQVRLFSVLARLKAGASIERATSELAAVRANRARVEGRPGPPRLRAMPYADKLVGHARTPLLILLGAVVLVLGIACANIANLLLARASARRREIAIRVAIGAGHGRVLRQFIVESLTLAVAGGAAGLLVARGGLAVMLALVPYAVPRLTEATIDGRVLAFVLTVAVGTALVVGAIPALELWRANPKESLQNGGGPVAAAGPRMRSALVVAEIALAAVLLVGAALMLKSLWRITAPPAGLAPEHVLTMRFQSGPRLDYISEVIRRAQSLPGVQAAGTSSNGDVRTRLQIEGAPDVPMQERPSVALSATSGGYAAAIGMRVVKGRWFAEHEPIPVCVINESLARRHFAGQDPIGHRLYIPKGPTTGDFVPIVGVVSDLRYLNLEAPVQPELFVHYEHITLFGMNLAIRTRDDPIASVASIRAALSQIDKTRPIFNVKTLEDVLIDSVAPRRFNVFLLTTFAGTALLLAVVGIYGVIAFSVAQRTREIGVRMALGAERRAVVTMVVRQGMRIAAAGIVLGIAAALALTQVIAGLLYEVTPTDPLTFAVAIGALALAALAACAGPAVRAALVNPIVALRCE
jgi:putative ABC transport system permease protein